MFIELSEVCKNRLKEQEPMQEEEALTEALALAGGLHVLNCEQ